MRLSILTAALQELTPRNRRDADPDLAIEWPISRPQLSKKDEGAPSLREQAEQRARHLRSEAEEHPLVRAVLDLRPDLWFFPCHFKGDPVMPGCLGLDALWQLLGFFLGWLGSPGKGRALGLGELKFSGQVGPTVRQVIYGIDIKRVMRSKLVLGIADGWLSADGSIIYRAMDLKVGLFRQEAVMEPSGG